MSYRFIVCLSLLALAGCKKDTPPDPDPVEPETLTIKVWPKFANQNLELNQTFQLNDTTDIQITEIKFYMSDITSGGVVKKDYALYDYGLTGGTLFTIEGTPAGFTDFSALVGVPASVNNDDPSAFPSSSPLNIANANDMHWGWSFGYIFIKIEARIDTIPDGIPLFDQALTYHVGTNAYTGNMSFPQLTWDDSHAHTARLWFDLERFINHPTTPIDVYTEQTTHSGAGQEALTQKVLDNFIDSFTAE